jgi:deazaflavin-dependent oxidoreductase (nitroreductase family)
MDINELNSKVIAEFRANAGKVGGQFEGTPLLLLSTVGAKSGAERLNPLAYLDDGERLVIIASYAGAEQSPPWYFNLRKNPEVGVELGGESFRARAQIIAEPERSALFQAMVAQSPVFADYQAKTKRAIPVITLSRLD